MFIYHISQQYVDLAIAEIEILLGPTQQLTDEYYLVDAYSKKTRKLAYTKEVYEVLGIGSTADDVYTEPEDEYRLDVVGEATMPHADALYAQYHKSVNVSSPTHFYKLFKLDQYYFTKRVYKNSDNGLERRAHLRAHNHPTSMHPLLAKAMINISGSDSFYDPFCGAGGILIEGAMMEVACKGSDISSEMIRRAKDNFSSLELDISVLTKDALDITGKYEAIVTDLPYGRSSQLKDQELYAKFLFHAKEHCNTLVVGCEEGKLKDLLGWKLVKRFLIYTHKSLTREILLLHK